MLYILYRGVTVHKIHGSVRYVTVRYVFDMGGGAIGYVAMLEIFLFYIGEPMDITQAHVCTRVCTHANLTQYLGW